MILRRLVAKFWQAEILKLLFWTGIFDILANTPCSTLSIRWLIKWITYDADFQIFYGNISHSQYLSLAQHQETVITLVSTSHHHVVCEAFCL